MTTTVNIIGVPMDLGQSLRGDEMGPSEQRSTGLEDHLRRLRYNIKDYGNIDIPVRDMLSREGNLAFLPAVVRACEAMYQLGQTAIEAGHFPLFIGGDHSIAIGTVGGVTHTGPAGLLWIDAHGD